jgi:hypothetical protein
VRRARAIGTIPELLLFVWQFLMVGRVLQANNNGSKRFGALDDPDSGVRLRPIDLISGPQYARSVRARQLSILHDVTRFRTTCCSRPFNTSR